MSRAYCITVLALVLYSSPSYASESGKISGKVYHDDGTTGINGAIVYIYNSSCEIFDTAVTSSIGFFEKSIPAGEYYISAEKGNYVREFFPGKYSFFESEIVGISPNQNVSVSFNLERGGWIGGNFDPGGEDVQSGLVVALKIDQPEAGWYKSAILSGSFPKNYAISGLIPGIYKVFGQATGKNTIYYPGVENAEDADQLEVIREEGVPDISFVLQPVGVGTLSGRIFDVETDSGLPGIRVLAYQWQNMEEDPNLKMTVTDCGGNFTFGLSSGKYYLCARCENCSWNTGTISLYYNNQLEPSRAETIDIYDGDVVDNIDFGFDFSNAYNLSISGRIYDRQTGGGLGGVSVMAINYDTGEETNSSISTENGDFSIDYLISGKYLVMFSEANVISYFYRDRETWQDAEIIDLSSDYRGIQTEAITQDYGNLGLAISGSVTTQYGSLSEARVYAYLVDDDRPTAFSITSASGEYTIIRGLVPGSYRIVCDMYGYDSETYPDVISLDLLDNPIADNINFYLGHPITEVSDRIEIPQTLQVLPNYPNPFNAQTMIQIYSGNGSSKVTRITVYNILGMRVGDRQVTIEPGLNYIEWGQDDFDRAASSGIYFYKVDGIDRMYRMVFLK